MPGQCPGPQTCPRARPKQPLAHEQGSCPLALPCLAALTWDLENPQEPNGPNCQALGRHGDRGNQGQGGAPQTQPAPPQQGGCSLFVLCSMLGGGQLRRRGRFHMSMEIWGPRSGPGEGQPGEAGCESLLPAGRLRCCPRIPQMGVRQVGGRDGGAPASPRLPGITVRGCPPGMSRGPGDPGSWGSGVRPASARRWEPAPPHGSDPGGSSQATWKTREGAGGTTPCLCSFPGC